VRNKYLPVSLERKNSIFGGNEGFGPTYRKVSVPDEEDPEIVDVVVVNSIMLAEGGGEGVKGARVKGWGSSYQARDQSGWEFAPMSKNLVFQVSRGSSLFFARGLINNCLYIV
jgi:hypothetical protein